MLIKQTHDKAATVATYLHWIPISLAEPPIGGKVLLIDDKQRIAYLRDYMPRQGWTHWFPLPTFREMK